MKLYKRLCYTALGCRGWLGEEEGWLQLVRHYAAWGAGVMSPLARHTPTQGYDTDIALSYPYHVQDPPPSTTLRGLNKIGANTSRPFGRIGGVRFFFLKKNIILIFANYVQFSGSPLPVFPFWRISAAVSKQQIRSEKKSWSWRGPNLDISSIQPSTFRFSRWPTFFHSSVRFQQTVHKILRESQQTE